MSDIVCTRVSAVRVDEAPEEALISLSLLDGAVLDIVVYDDKVNIGNQVLYQVVGWDAEKRALKVKLVEDYR